LQPPGDVYGYRFWVLVYGNGGQSIGSAEGIQEVAVIGPWCVWALVRGPPRSDDDAASWHQRHSTQDGAPDCEWVLRFVECVGEHSERRDTRLELSQEPLDTVSDFGARRWASEVGGMR
jgi:hypothetical protein